MFGFSKSRKKNRTKLGLESLNCRIVPAVVVTQLDLDGDAEPDDIRIVGDSQSSKITITENGSNQFQLQIDANGDGDFTDVALGDKNTAFGFDKNSFLIDAQLKGGHDSFTYSVSNNWSSADRTIIADMSGGNDTFTFNMGSRDILNGSIVSIDVTAGAGNDTITINHDEVRNTVESIKVDAGTGADKYDLDFDRIDDKTSVDVHTELGAGLNVHNVDVQEVGIGDKAWLDMVIVGGNQKDTIELRMHDDIGNGTIASRFSAVVDLLGGYDDFKALFDVGGAAFRVDDHSQASVVVRGGAGNDSILAGQNGPVGTIRIDPDGLLSIDLDGGLGNDHLVTNFGLADAFEILGTIRVRMDGGLGIDTMTCFLANNVDSTGVYDVAVRGGAGNDIMSFLLFDGGGAPTFGPAGGIILDGGLGVDSVTNGNPGVTKVVGLETVI